MVASTGNKALVLLSHSIKARKVGVKIPGSLFEVIYKIFRNPKISLSQDHLKPSTLANSHRKGF